MKKRNLYIFVVLSLCIFGILFWHVTGAQAAAEVQAATATERAETLKTLVLEAYQGYRTEVDLEKYAFYNTVDSALINRVMEEVINATPELFYTGRQFSKEVVDGTEQIVKLDLTYSDAYMKNGAVNTVKIERDKRKVNAEAKKALAVVNDEMSDVEKAMVLHDYLVGLLEYNDSKSKSSRLTTVGALVEHKANCQGYSVTYKMLLEKAGIAAECLSSRKMSHMWNLVKVGGKWYHVDVTWDDPVNEKTLKEQYGIVLHDNFLLSNAGIKRSGHYDCNTKEAVSTKYDNAYWKKVGSAFWYQSGRFVYADKAGIYTRASLTGGKAVPVMKLSARCLVKQSANKYYLLGNNRIYQLNIKTKKLKSVYKAPSGCNLLELKYCNKKLYFRYQKKNTVYSKMKKI